MAAAKVENEAIDLLKTDSKGWTIALFEDQNKITTCLCENCNHICCDAVELACDHDDTDIYLYCKNCLNNLIQDNDNKCPINSHSDPEIAPNRASRRQVLKSKVYCPYSSQYKSQNINYKPNDNNAQMIDTIGGPNDEKEGIIFNYKQNENKCNWNGTLNDLIKIHITKCVQKNDPIFTQHITIKKLKDENKNLRVTNNDFQQQIIALTEKNEIINKQLNEQSILIQELIQSKDVTKKRENKLNDNDEKKQIYELNNISKKFVFNLSKDVKGNMYLSNNGKTVHLKGGWFDTDSHHVLIGDYLKNNDNVTVFIECKPVGNVWHYGFGFISSKFGNVFVGNYSHQVMIDGGGVISVNDEFKPINKLNKQNAILNKSVGLNTIVMSVNMKHKTGIIFNDKTNVKINVNLPENEQIGMVIMMYGTNKKSMSISKVEIRH